ncbi:MAG: hypothetical protein D6820_04605, partial [Lentisphaerae bacterium]
CGWDGDPTKHPEQTQVSAYAESKDGLHFEALDDWVGPPYMRTFRYGPWYYALHGGSQRLILRAQSPWERFIAGPRLEVPGEPYTSPQTCRPQDKRVYRMRHVGLLRTGADQLDVYYSNVGDCPERLKRCRLLLRNDWQTWTAGAFEEILAPAEPWEGADQPLLPSQPGSIHKPVRQLRDPYPFISENKTFLYYAGAGESAIGVAWLEHDP